jgi:hypothetical protein
MIASQTDTEPLASLDYHRTPCPIKEHLEGVIKIEGAAHRVLVVANKLKFVAHVCAGDHERKPLMYADYLLDCVVRLTSARLSGGREALRTYDDILVVVGSDDQNSYDVV